MQGAKSSDPQAFPLVCIRAVQPEQPLRIPAGTENAHQLQAQSKVRFTHVIDPFQSARIRQFNGQLARRSSYPCVLVIQTGENIIDVMKHMNEQDGTTFIFSTHDHRVMHHAHRIVTLEDGLITNTDAPALAVGA